ncbi:hypothetical protein PAPHI01_1176 [Pancytospora philotis]|nr:hypothetical protein PAPHI01_1176 [Pancytospora philotis]
MASTRTYTVGALSILALSDILSGGCLCSNYFSYKASAESTPAGSERQPAVIQQASASEASPLALPSHDEAGAFLLYFLERFTRAYASDGADGYSELCKGFKKEAMSECSDFGRFFFPDLPVLQRFERDKDHSGDYSKLKEMDSAKRLQGAFEKDSFSNIFDFIRIMEPELTAERILFALSSKSEYEQVGKENAFYVKHLAELIAMYSTFLQEQPMELSSGSIDAITLSDIDSFTRDCSNSPGANEASCKYDTVNMSGEDVLKALVSANVVDPEDVRLYSTEEAESFCSKVKEVNSLLAYSVYSRTKLAGKSWFGVDKLNEMLDAGRLNPLKFRNIAGYEYDGQVAPREAFEAQITRPKLLALLVEHAIRRIKQKPVTAQATKRGVKRSLSED